MTTKTATHVYKDVFENLRKATESNLKMQQDMLRQWTTLWPGVSSPQSAWPQSEWPQSEWVDKVRDFQKQWGSAVSGLAKTHRDTLDKQYEAALASFEEALRVGESSSPEEFRERTEQLFRKTLDCMREVSETQMSEFQAVVNTWSELVTKSDS